MTGDVPRHGRRGTFRDLIAVELFLTLTHLMAKAGTFWLFGAVSVGAWCFAYFLVPETKGKTLKEIQTHGRAGKRPGAL